MPLGMPAPQRFSQSGGSLGGVGSSGAFSKHALGMGTDNPVPTTTSNGGGRIDNPTTGMPTPTTTSAPFTPQPPKPQGPPANIDNRPYSWWDPNLPAPPAAPKTPEQMMAEWLKNQANLTSANAQNQWTNAMNQIGLTSAYGQQNVGHINATYGNDLNILNAQQYADVDLALKQLGIDKEFLTKTWGLTQGNIGGQQQSANKLYQIQKWLTDKNRGYTTAERDLSFDRTRSEWGTQRRKLMSAATGAGAFTSAGHRADQSDAIARREQGLTAARLTHDRSQDQLTAGDRQDLLSRDDKLRELLYQLNTGQAKYDHDMRGYGVQEEGINNTGRIYGYRRDQLANDRDHGINQSTYQTGSEINRTMAGAQNDQNNAILRILQIMQQGLI